MSTAVLIIVQIIRSDEFIGRLSDEECEMFLHVIHGLNLSGPTF